jgi:hypothetical protein
MTANSNSQPQDHNLSVNKSPKKQTDKQQRLARALRENLLRRKAIHEDPSSEGDAK